MDVRTKLLALVLVVLAACDVGEVPSGGMTPDATMTTNNNTGETSFNSTIKPLVTTCTGCHSGSTSPTLTSFSALQAKYKTKPGSTNILVTKGNHQGITYLSSADRMKVAMWIDSL